MRFAKSSTLAVVGTGLIGASMAAALGKMRARPTLICIDRSSQTRRLARELGLFEHAFARFSEIGRPVDMVFIAVPVLAFGDVLQDIAPHVGDKTILFDGGSVKMSVIRDAQKSLGPKASRFVPCHPIAGREFNGIDAADPELFRKRNVIVCGGKSAPDAVRSVKTVWKRIGATVRNMDAELHDRAFSAVSHLPHALAYALVDMVGNSPFQKHLLDNAASGFRDFTRIASSSPEMWKDILIANRANMLKTIEDYERSLRKLKKGIRTEDHETLLKIFGFSKSLRSRWLKRIEK